MAGPYRPKVTEGAPGGGNPKCNQATSAGITLSGTPSAAEVAAKAQARYAEQHAQQEAYRLAKQVAREKPKSDPKRWLSNGDLAWEDQGTPPLPK